MTHQTHAAAVRAEDAIRGEFSVGTCSQSTRDENDFEDAPAGEMAKRIHYEYAALVEAAESLCNSTTEREMAQMAIALRAELARVKGKSNESNDLYKET